MGVLSHRAAGIIRVNKNRVLVKALNHQHPLRLINRGDGIQQNKEAPANENSISVSQGDGFVFVSFDDAVFFDGDSSVLRSDGKKEMEYSRTKKHSSRVTMSP